MLAKITVEQAEEILSKKFKDYSWGDFNLHWTDLEDTSHIVNILSDCSEILEIGTYLGHTTENIAKNTNGIITTVDVCKGIVDSTKYQNHELLDCSESGSVIESTNVNRILRTSDDFFAATQDNSFDGILIDGDHSYEQVKKDTLNALRVVKFGGVIVWHDVYNNDGIMCPKTRCQPDNMDVVRVLNELDIQVYKINRSWVGFYVR